MILFLKNLLFVLLVPGTVAVYLPLFIVARYGGGGTYRWGVQALAAIFFLSLGAVIYIWCVWNFAVTGRGTPLPIDAPKKLIVVGLYKYIRNPMYVGVLTTIAGWALYYRMWQLIIYAVIFWLIVQLFVVVYEEPTLKKLFGESYIFYCKNVGRWIPTFSNKSKITD